MPARVTFSWVVAAGLRAGLLASLLAGLTACGGSSPTSPTTPTPPATTTPPAATGSTFTIDGNGATPRELVVAPGTRVVFINRGSRSHQMSSDPHPEHTDCPEINQVGFLRPGDTRETGNLNTPRTCGFHDHDDPGNASLRGRIIIRP